MPQGSIGRRFPAAQGARALGISGPAAGGIGAAASNLNPATRKTVVDTVRMIAGRAGGIARAVPYLGWIIGLATAGMIAKDIYFQWKGTFAEREGLKLEKQKIVNEQLATAMLAASENKREARGRADAQMDRAYALREAEAGRSHESDMLRQAAMADSRAAGADAMMQFLEAPYRARAAHAASRGAVSQDIDALNALAGDDPLAALGIR